MFTRVEKGHAWVQMSVCKILYKDSSRICHSRPVFQELYTINTIQNIPKDRRRKRIDLAVHVSILFINIRWSPHSSVLPGLYTHSSQFQEGTRKRA